MLFELARVPFAALARLRSGRGVEPSAEETELLRDALGAAGVALEDVPVLRLDAGTEDDARLLLQRASEELIVGATVAVWPRGRGAAVRGGRLLRPRGWWHAEAERAGLRPALDFRRDVDGVEALVLTRLGGSEPGRYPRRARPEVLVRVNDPLDVANSFAWISASIALALEELEIPVSIAPTAISASFDPDRRARLEALIEPPGRPPSFESEIGWTHFWPRYRRPLAGRVPLPLFAINYRFAQRDPAAFDPWMRGLVEAGGPLAPISTFCQEVLADAGLPAERAPVVPMACTDGLQFTDPGHIPGERELRILHVTNAADAARNGTDLALASYEEAFAPDDPVTLVVRDYGGNDLATAARVAALRDRGYDARHWPAFFPQDRLGDFLASFDVLLAPFRGEGFGIKLLDSMACGAAPIAPLFGGPRDFLDEAVAYPVEFDIVPVTEGYDAENLRLGNSPEWAECRHDSLVAALRAAASDPVEAQERGARGRQRALTRFRWVDTARRVAELAHNGSH